MKTIVYIGGGPDTIIAGAAGQFTKDVPREIEDDEIADQLLVKGYFTEYVPVPDTAGKSTKPAPTKPAPLITGQATTKEEV
jgi:hypothetical protein